MKRRYLAVLVILVLLLGPLEFVGRPRQLGSARPDHRLAAADRPDARARSTTWSRASGRSSRTSTPETSCARSRSSSSPSTRSRRRWRSSPATGASRPASSSSASLSSRAARSAAATGTLSSVRRRSPSDWDLEHYYDWSAVRRMNLIRTRNEKGPERADAGRVARPRGDPGPRSARRDEALLARLLAAALGPGCRRARERHGRDGRHPDGHARARPGGAQRQAPEPPPGARGGDARLRWTWSAGHNRRLEPPRRGCSESDHEPRRRAARARWRSCVLLLARPALAFHIPIPDPVETGLLAKIAALSGTIQRIRMLALEKWHQQIQVRLSAYAFPEAPLQPGVRDHLDGRRTSGVSCNRLACVWPTTPPHQRPGGSPLQADDLLPRRLPARRGALTTASGTRSCRRRTTTSATMTANMISERTEKTNTELGAGPARPVPRHRADLSSSPGEANRAEAAALAWTNEVALGNGQILTQNLLAPADGP